MKENSNFTLQTDEILPEKSEVDNLTYGTLDIRLMDCMDLMKEYPDNHFDLAIVDPPYGDSVKSGGYMYNKMGNSKYNKKYNLALWKQSKPLKDYFNELARVSQNQIVWGANHFISEMPYDSPAWICWDKKRDSQSWADFELAYTSFDRSGKIFRFAWDGFRQEDMKNKESRIHPTQKPVALYKWLLANYAKQGMKILDTHLGSGSHAIACYYAGMHLTACEIDPDYYEASMARIERETVQLKLL